MTLEDIQKQIDASRGQMPQLSAYNNAPAGSDFSEQLRTRLTSGTSVENIIKSVADQRARLLAIPAETRAQMPIGVYSPTQAAGVIAAREEPVRSSYETLMGVKQAREGRMTEIIDRATKGYEAQIEKQKQKFEQERQKLSDLTEERNWLTDQAYQKAQLGFEERRLAVAERPSTKAPVTREIDGVLYEYDETTGQWVKANVATPPVAPAPDYIKDYRAYKNAGWTREQLERTWISQYNESQPAANKIKDKKDIDSDVKAALDQVYGAPEGLSGRILGGAADKAHDWWSGLWQ